MITITVNGEPRLTKPGLMVAELVSELTGVHVHTGGEVPDGAALGIAVAVNSVVVPRTGWAAEELADGDAVEIVTATQGG